MVSEIMTIPQMLDKLILLLLAAGLIALTKYLESRKNKKNSVALINPNPNHNLNPYCSGGHCKDHSRLMDNVSEMKVDAKETKTDVKWIKKKLNH